MKKDFKICINGLLVKFVFLLERSGSINSFKTQVKNHNLTKMEHTG